VKTTDVRLWDVRKLQRRNAAYEVRWVVAGRERSRTRSTKGLADAFLADLRAAARRGELFDTETGLPDSMQPVSAGPTWLQFAQDYVDTKWPLAAAKSRGATIDALATVTAALISKDAPPIDPLSVRAALRNHLLPPSSREIEAPAELQEAIRWLKRHSVVLTELSQPVHLRRALDAIALTLDGQPAAATTIRRKRAVLNNALQYAVETEQLPANKLGQIGWRVPKTSETVDRRVVVNPTQARELLTAVTYVGPVDRGRHLRGFFACMYYAGLRPAETQALAIHDCQLPTTGWGHLILAKSRPESNRRWTDSGDTH
jgi:hypothetical protein